MSALKNRIGPYHYPDGFLVKKSFNEHEGIPRSFTILVSSALNAGIVGPEINGIVVLDDDNRAVVLDRHLQQSSGYYGPSELQKAEFNRIQSMDWAAFSAFCRTNPRYRSGSMPDATAEIPDDGRLPQPETVIFAAAEKPPSDAPYSFPLSTRREIVEFLSAHSGHDANGHDFALSWDVKVRHLDTTLGSCREEFELEDRFDERWKAVIDKDTDMFWDACSDGLRQWTEGDYSIYPGENQGSYQFSTSGRSGGYVVLTKCFDDRMVFSSRSDFVRWLENEASDESLVELYKVVVSCDQDLGGNKPAEAVEYELAGFRKAREEEWAQELAAAPGGP